MPPGLKLLLSFWPIFLFFAILAVIKFTLDNRGKKNEEKVVSPYEKKPFIFDSKNELDLYNILLELFGDKYHIFVQVNYSHLIQTKNPYDRRDRSRIDKKSADFVLCDKEHVIPKLVIELDGFSHQTQKAKERDYFINKVMSDINFPILHLGNKDIGNKELIKSEIINKLTKK